VIGAKIDCFESSSGNITIVKSTFQFVAKRNSSIARGGVEMKAAFTLIPSESRRLIAKGVSQMEKVKSANESG